MAYRFEGKQRTKTHGLYPDTKLVKARVLREEVKGMVLEGTDPDPERKRNRRRGVR